MGLQVELVWGYGSRAGRSEANLTQGGTSLGFVLVLTEQVPGQTRPVAIPSQNPTGAKI